MKRGLPFRLIRSLRSVTDSFGSPVLEQNLRKNGEDE